MSDEVSVAGADGVVGEADDGTQGVVGEADDALKKAFEAIESGYRPEWAGGRDVVIRFDVAAPDGVHSYQVVVADGACSASAGVPESPRLMLGIDLADLHRFVAGELDLMDAFLAGRVRLSGDLALARSMQHWLA